ncbi:MAG TPA: hypothetical protein VK427_20440 [Kofleriaceae bacterium]|nr:hypothetical protein [Kofleriaceae bacterium]
MRILLALAFVAAACGGPKKKPEGAIVNEGSATTDTCCCKSNPLTSEDGRPVYELGNRMECSSKQGTCVDEVQCNTAAQPE